MLASPGIPLKLSGVPPLTAGAQKLIYAHPDRADRLIKLPRDPDNPGVPDYRKRPSRYGRYFSVLRELEERLALAAQAPDDLVLIERAEGLIETDLGTGLLVETLSRPSGRLAPTLFHLLKKRGRLTRSQTALLDRFLARLLDSPLIAHDLKARNIVLAHEAGERRFVLVDGIGERYGIPVNRMSRTINRLNKARRIRRLRAEMAELAGRAD